MKRLLATLLLLSGCIDWEGIYAECRAEGRCGGFDAGPSGCPAGVEVLECSAVPLRSGATPSFALASSWSQGWLVLIGDQETHQHQLLQVTASGAVSALTTLPGNAGPFLPALAARDDAWFYAIASSAPTPSSFACYANGQASPVMLDVPGGAATLSLATNGQRLAAIAVRPGNVPAFDVSTGCPSTLNSSGVDAGTHAAAVALAGLDPLGFRFTAMDEAVHGIELLLPDAGRKFTATPGHPGGPHTATVSLDGARVLVAFEIASSAALRLTSVAIDGLHDWEPPVFLDTGEYPGWSVAPLDATTYAVTVLEGDVTGGKALTVTRFTTAGQPGTLGLRRSIACDVPNLNVNVATAVFSGKLGVYVPRTDGADWFICDLPL